MTTPFTYDFGYSWWIVWGHLVPIALFGGLAFLGLWLGWRRWLVGLSGLLAMWGVAGLLITHFLFRINLPMPASFASPHALAHHPAADPNRWRALLESSGFDVVEQGTQPGALYFFSRKSRS